MKTKFTDKLFEKSIDSNILNKVVGGIMAASGSSCATETNGGCDMNTQTYDDKGNQTSNKTVQNDREGC